MASSHAVARVIGRSKTLVTSENARHWDEVVRTKEADQFSWYQADPSMSMRLVEHAPGSVIDVGAGTSTFVDHVLAAGRTDVTVAIFPCDLWNFSNARRSMSDTPSQ